MCPADVFKLLRVDLKSKSLALYPGVSELAILEASTSARFERKIRACSCMPNNESILVVISCSCFVENNRAEIVPVLFIIIFQVVRVKITFNIKIKSGKNRQGGKKER
jgi:hypothetical protein